MTFEITTQADRPAVTVRFSGIVERADVIAAIRALASDGAFSTSKRLWDLRGCELDVTTEDLREIADTSSEAGGKGDGVGVLVDRDVNFGIVRIHMALRDPEDQQYRLFRDQSEAIAWLDAE
jgi:hypothetical protein